MTRIGVRIVGDLYPTDVFIGIAVSWKVLTTGIASGNDLRAAWLGTEAQQAQIQCSTGRLVVPHLARREHAVSIVGIRHQYRVDTGNTVSDGDIRQGNIHQADVFDRIGPDHLPIRADLRNAAVIGIVRILAVGILFNVDPRLRWNRHDRALHRATVEIG